MQPIQLLAVLGRGIQQIKEGAGWTLTEDLEVCDEKLEHLPVRIPADDANLHCLIGGGELNLLAGIVLCCGQDSESLTTAVCAYGARSAYLRKVNGPSESEVMSTLLKEMQRPGVKLDIPVWSSDHVVLDERGMSGTNREVQNVFELAVQRGLTSVGIVTVAVQYARAVLMAQRYLQNPRFAHITLQCYISEDILLRHDPKRFEQRIKALHGSNAFMRSMFYEQRGINCLLAGNY